MNKFLQTNTTNYNGISSIYFLSILKNIIKIGNLNRKELIILDFGCGNKQLSKLLPNNKVINYDIKKEYTEIDDYKKVKFDVVVLNAVLLYLTKNEMIELINNFKAINNNCELVVGIPRINLLSKMGKFILREHNAHIGIVSDNKTQISVLDSCVKKIAEKNVFFMTDIYYGKLK